MSMLALFDLEAPEWVPIVKPLGYNLVSYIADDLCRDCGAQANYNQGGAGNAGAFMVCDECAAIDDCKVRPHTPVVEDRPGRFGMQLRQAAHCENCGWWIDRQRWDDEGAWVDLTPEEVLDLCAEHARPKHTSHWGISHEIGAHDGLVTAREKRRARYLARLKSQNSGRTPGDPEGIPT